MWNLTKVLSRAATGLAVLLALTPLTSHAQQAANVTVSVTPLTLNGQTTYQYKVTNNSSERIVSLSIGSDYYHGVSELTAYPNGWTVDAGIQAGSVLSPPSWNPTVVTTEESAAVEIQWRNNGTADVMPGQTLGGFAVVVPGQSAPYLTGHWTVILGNATAASGMLLQSGSPRISLKVSSISSQTGTFTAILDVLNSGGATANNVTLTKLIPRTLVGTSAVTLSGVGLPLNLGAIAAGAKSSVTVTFSAPQDVKKLSLTEQGSLTDATGTSFSFSGSQAIYTKQ